MMCLNVRAIIFRLSALDHGYEKIGKYFYRSEITPFERSLSKLFQKIKLKYWIHGMLHVL